LRKTLLIFLCTTGILIVPCGGFYLPTTGQLHAGAAILGFAVLFAAALVHLMITPNEALTAWIQLTELLLLPFAIQRFAGVFAASGTALLWSLLAPKCALVLHVTRAAIAWSAAFAMLVLYFFVTRRAQTHFLNYTTSQS
jgi:hypothetical protein